MNKGDGNTLDNYLKEHTHMKLSERPAEVDRTGLLRAIDEIGNEDDGRAKSDMQLKKIRRNHHQTYDGTTKDQSNVSSRKMLKLKQEKVNPTRDFSGYQEHLKKEAFQRMVETREQEMKEE
jgi:hypothetical protein